MTAICERVVESYLTAAVEQRGGVTRKASWQGRRDAPDRIVFLNGVYFIELKRPGSKPRKSQEQELRLLKKLGANVDVIDSVEDVDIFIERILG